MERKDINITGRVAVLAAVVCTTVLYAADVTVALPPKEVTVVAQAIEPHWAKASGRTLGEEVDRLPGVTLGSQGTQTRPGQISVQGSGQGGAGYTVGGLGLRNTRTGDVNADFPVAPALLTVPGLMTSVEQAREVDGHAVGSVALTFADRRSGNTAARVGGHAPDGLLSHVLLHRPLGHDDDRGTTLDVFGTFEDATSLDSLDNGLERREGGFLLQRRAPGSVTDVLASGSRRVFGATGFHGADPSWLAEESIKQWLVLGTTRWRRRGRSGRVTALARRVDDAYRLSPPDAATYTESHRTDVYSGMADGWEPISGRWLCRWRAAGTLEQLDGESSGRQERTRAAATVMPRYERGGVYVEAGARAEVLSSFDDLVLPQVGVGAVLPFGCRATLGYAESVRRPSLRELEDDSPVRLGDPDLRLEPSRALQLDLVWAPVATLEVDATLFVRETAHTIEWARQSAEDRWAATDLGHVSTLGAGFSVNHVVAGRYGVAGDYAWLTKDADVVPYAGRFVLDYPEHQVSLGGFLHVNPRLQLTTRHQLRLQTENAERGSSRTGLFGVFGVRMQPVALGGAEMALALENAWADTFEVLPGDPPVQQRLRFSIAKAW